MYKTMYRGIAFVEGTIPGAQILEPYRVSLGFRFGAQLKNLRDVKDKFVEAALRCGANAVLDFTYGQKSRLFAIDDVACWDRGVLGLPPAEGLGQIPPEKNL